MPNPSAAAARRKRHPRQLPAQPAPRATPGAVFPANALGVKVELLLNGTWTDVTRYVLGGERANVSITRGRADESSNMNVSTLQLTFNNRDGRFSPRNVTGAYYPFIGRNTQIRVSVKTTSVTGVQYSGYRFWGEVSAWPPRWDSSGTDVYVPIVASGVTRRLQQNSPIGSAIRRYLSLLTGSLIPVAYWPMEEATSAGQFGNLITPGNSLTWTVTPTLASDTGFQGSDPLPLISLAAMTGSTGSFSTSGDDVFTSPGTHSWVSPLTGTVNVKCWGGGGGGGGTRDNSNVATDGGQGGLSVFSGDSVFVETDGGGGGAAGVNGGTGTGGLGGNFGGTVTAAFSGGIGGDGGNLGGGRPVGGGGGGSAGTASSGNTGGEGPLGNNIGATAVTGGGPGGNGGFDVNNGGSQPASGPGGGGGGATATHAASGAGGGGAFAQNTAVAVTQGNIYTATVGSGGSGGSGFTTGGSGFAGKVEIVSTPTSVPSSVITRCLLHIPTTGATNNAIILKTVFSSGALGRAELYYGTGGNLGFRGFSSGGGGVFDSGATSFGADGHPFLISMELVQSGASVKWAMKVLAPGSTIVTFVSGTFSGTLGAASQVVVNPSATVNDTAIGHITVQYALDDVLNLAAAINGNAGETAGARFQRFCKEEALAYEFNGSTSDTPLMGPQQNKKLSELLQEIEDADRGQLFEPRDMFGLGYSTRVSLMNQNATLSVDYTNAHLADVLEPSTDDQLVRNDITVSRQNGADVNATLTSGALSIQSPPNGVGDYSYALTANVNSDAQLTNLAQWILNVGTVDEYRYPTVSFDQTRTEVATLLGQIAILDIGNYFQIFSPPAWLPSGTIKQLAFGFTETLSQFQWTISVNAVPESPYEGAGLTW